MVVSTATKVGTIGHSNELAIADGFSRYPFQTLFSEPTVQNLARPSHCSILLFFLQCGLPKHPLQFRVQLLLHILGPLCLGIFEESLQKDPSLDLEQGSSSGSLHNLGCSYIQPKDMGQLLFDRWLK